MRGGGRGERQRTFQRNEEEGKKESPCLRDRRDERYETGKREENPVCARETK